MEKSKKVYGPYQNNCTRPFVIIIENGQRRVQSYSRYLMEQKLGYPLDPNIDIHHKDGNPNNNDLNNLELKLHGEHQREHSQKYYDKIAECGVCGKKFIWTAESQRKHFSNLSRTDKRYSGIIACSKRCVGIYGRQEQLRRDS